MFRLRYRTLGGRSTPRSLPFSDSSKSPRCRGYLEAWKKILMFAAHRYIVMSAIFTVIKVMPCKMTLKSAGHFVFLEGEISLYEEFDQLSPES